MKFVSRWVLPLAGPVAFLLLWEVVCLMHVVRPIWVTPRPSWMWPWRLSIGW